MEISEIKAQFTIGQVLDHYNLSADKNNMLCCPFHNDKTPSLQIYPQTNTFCCFSSNCHAGTGDVIEFIRLMEKCTKHEAILKAKSLLGHAGAKPEQPEELSRVAIIAKYIEAGKKGIAGSERARMYATERGLNWQMLSLGFTGEKVQDGWNKNYKESAASLGLLTKTKDGRYVNRFKNCLVFALQNAQGHSVGIYGRGLDKGHYYLPGPHQGLYPKYPGAATKKLILTEAIIDAATLYQDETITKDYSALACYGTNGFTKEHEQAIKALQHLEEVILFFDGDEAGREGTKKLVAQLHELRSDLTISQVHTPEGDDVNSLGQAHEKQIFTHLLQSRAIIFSIEKEKATAPSSTYKLEILPHRFLYRTATANYHIKGICKETSRAYA
jgi:DNA primase